MDDKKIRLLFILVQAAAVCVFLGRGWQHIFWDAPYRALLWDEAWMSGIVERLFDMPWKEYVTSPQVDRNIQGWIKGTGFFYMICAITALFIRKLGKPGRIVLSLGGLNLVFLAALYCKEKFFFAGQFLEYTLQWSSPFFLAYFAGGGSFNSKAIFLLKVATALTFTCHGLYAAGYYPRPGNFGEMVISITGWAEADAITFLNIAGAMDFIVSVLIFLPKRIAIPALGYVVIWGFLTTLARIWAYFYVDFWAGSLHQWLHESIFRTPHFLLPLVILLYLVSERKLCK
jgi:hypothetical protein